MSELTTVLVIPNSQCKEFTSPNLTRACLIPCKLTVEANEGSKDAPELSKPRNVIVRVTSGGTVLTTNNEPYFQYSNEIDLVPFLGIVEQHGTISVSVQNRTGDRGEYHVKVTYTKCEGASVFEERMVQFSDVFQKIARKKCVCNTMILQFDKPLTKLVIEPTFLLAEGGEEELWVKPYDLLSHYMRVNKMTADQLSDFTALPSETPVVLDFMSDPHLKKYRDLIQYLKLKAETEDQTIATAYVLVAGFPKE
jgi:hypothetical protein